MLAYYYTFLKETSRVQKNCNIYPFMALFHFLLLISLCVACCEIDARSKTLLNEQNQFIASDSTMVFVYELCPL
jgi:hypothetical protein